jgi:hypothetical protein
MTASEDEGLNRNGTAGTEWLVHLIGALSRAVDQPRDGSVVLPTGG